MFVFTQHRLSPSTEAKSILEVMKLVDGGQAITETQNMWGG
jgi:hypothetical protein